MQQRLHAHGGRENMYVQYVQPPTSETRSLPSFSGVTIDPDMCECLDVLDKACLVAIGPRRNEHSSDSSAHRFQINVYPAVRSASLSIMETLFIRGKAGRNIEANTVHLKGNVGCTVSLSVACSSGTIGRSKSQGRREGSV